MLVRNHKLTTHQVCLGIRVHIDVRTHDGQAERQIPHVQVMHIVHAINLQVRTVHTKPCIYQAGQLCTRALVNLLIKSSALSGPLSPAAHLK